MREIEFRAKTFDTHSWVYGGFWMSKYNPHGGYSRYAYIREETYTWDKIEHRVDPSTLGQYAEQKDRKGNKIFEGDIVEVSITSSDPEGYAPLLLDKFIGEVYFDTLTSKFQIVRKTYIKEDNSYEYDQYDLTDCGVEVIGNIYDNPYLLDEKGE